MLALARCGDHAGAAERSPRRWWQHRPRMKRLYVQAACGYALAAGAAAGDAALVQHYTDKALECLRKAKEQRLGRRREPRDRYRPRTDPQRPGIPGPARRVPAAGRKTAVRRTASPTCFWSIDT